MDGIDRSTGLPGVEAYIPETGHLVREVAGRAGYPGALTPSEAVLTAEKLLICTPKNRGWT